MCLERDRLQMLKRADMKGMEGLPVRLIASCMIMLFVAGAVLYQLDFFLGFRTEKDFRESLSAMLHDMMVLRASGNSGAFTTSILTVPEGCNVSIDIDSGVIEGAFPGGKQSFGLRNLSIEIGAVRLSGDVIRKGIAFIDQGGAYDMRILYSLRPESIHDNEIKNFTIIFR